MYTCGTCWRQFSSGLQARQQHMNATGHEPPSFECDRCDRYCGTREAIEQYMNDMGHWDESSESEEPGESDQSEGTFYECDHCDHTFEQEDNLHDHEAKQHFYCVACECPFQYWNSISQVRMTLSTRSSCSIWLISPSTCAAKLTAQARSSVPFAKICMGPLPDSSITSSKAVAPRPPSIAISCTRSFANETQVV
ncbi:zinc finger protein [Fusarium beomiforme]|uniref:Zinc finger protein n=1 Tax=Fusarium beomiforme TaxID=44412 RepID=A0A9P5AA46_9HYPO|nr:zinc finger protein [Fusarium beomiforme]